MNTAKNQITKQIEKMQKQHDLIMKLHSKTCNEINPWGDGMLFEKADKIANSKQLLILALELIEKFESRQQ